MTESPLLLLVDDEPTSHAVAHQVLASAGWHVDYADAGETGVAIAAQRRYALILMDIQMPGLDGFGAARAIRAGGGASAAAPILAFTASRKGDLAGSIRVAGMDGLVAKPFTPKRLRDTVGRWWPAEMPAPARRLAATFGEAEIAGLIDRFRDHLEQALAADCADATARADAHKLAGVAGTLGFPDVYRPWLAVSEGDLGAYAEARVSARQALCQIATAART